MSEFKGEFGYHCKARCPFPGVQPDPEAGVQGGARRRPRGEGMPAHRDGAVPRSPPRSVPTRARLHRRREEQGPIV